MPFYPTMFCADCGNSVKGVPPEEFIAKGEKCHRCFYMQQFGLDPGSVEVRDMSTKGRSLIVVPRLVSTTLVKQ